MDKKRRFSVGAKMYLFVTMTVVVVALASLLISYYINANQIDNYFKGLTLDSARNMASFADAEFLKELKSVAASDEFQALREEAEENDDESVIEEYLKQKGLWERYIAQRDLLDNYLANMDDIKYLYIVATGDASAA